LIEIPAFKPAKELSVLIIDDQALVHDIVKTALLDVGIDKVRTAENAFFALRLCESQSFDIVIVAFNVKSDKDGFSLLEEMKFKGFVTKTTSVIFLSADTDPSLVNCVVELQPSDFWVKPLDRLKVEKRLSHILAVKKQLYRLHYCIDKKEYPSAIYIAQRQLQIELLAPYYPHINRLIGECFLHLLEYQEAENFYLQLAQKYKYGWVSIGLLKAVLKQKKYTESKDLIRELGQREDTRFAVYDLLAQFHIEEEDYELAYEEIKKASMLAPRNIERNRKLCELARLNHDRQGQYLSAQNMAKYAKNTIHNSPELMLNVIRSGIDLATTLSNSDSMVIVKRSEVQMQRLEAEFGQNGQLKEQLDIVKVRIHNVRNEKKQADEILKPYLEARSKVSIDDNLDRVKAFHELGYREESLSLLDKIKGQISGDSFSSKVLGQYIDQEAVERSEIHFTSKELNEMAAEHYKNKRMTPALTALTNAFQLAPESLQIAMSALKVLSVVMERQEYLEEKQLEFAKRCTDLLDSKPLVKEQSEKLKHYKEVLGLTEQVAVEQPEQNDGDEAESNSIQW
jgi:DNA-binding NarL/FixJ family response regulator